MSQYIRAAISIQPLEELIGGLEIRHEKKSISIDFSLQSIHTILNIIHKHHGVGCGEQWFTQGGAAGRKYRLLILSTKKKK